MEYDLLRVYTNNLRATKIKIHPNNCETAHKTINCHYHRHHDHHQQQKKLTKHHSVTTFSQDLCVLPLQNDDVQGPGHAF